MTREETIALLKKLGIKEIEGQIDFSQYLFSKVILRKQNLDGAYFTQAQLQGADLRWTSLRNSEFIEAYLVGAKLHKTDLENATFANADLSGVKLIEANLSHTLFHKTILKGADFFQANITGAEFVNAELEGSDLSKAVLKDSKFERATLRKHDFTQKEFFNIAFDKCDLSGSIFRNKVLKNCIFTNCKLSNIKFVDCDIHECNFEKSELLEGVFEKSRLSEINLRNANLQGSSFLFTEIKNTDFSRADLSKANFLGVKVLQNCRFEDTIIENSILTESIALEAQTEGALLAGVRLRTEDEANEQLNRLIEKDNRIVFETDLLALNNVLYETVPQLKDIRNIVANKVICDPRWDGRPIEQVNLCFVLMPFDQKLRVVYDEHIKPVVESAGLDCRRADDIFDNNPIMDDIWKNIYHSKLVIADLTDRNANVFYELGMCHTLGKEVILITQNEDDIPFDVKPLRFINYKYTPPGMRKFEEELALTLNNVLKRIRRDSDQALFRNIDAEIYNILRQLELL